MKACLVFLLTVAGCFDTSDGQPHPDAAVDAVVAPEPAACASDHSLDLVTYRSELLDLPLTDAGTTLCMHLDATARTHPTYFEGTTETPSSTTSSFGLAIYSDAGELITTSHDYPIGGATGTSASIELDQAATYSVKLVAWSHAPSGTASLKLMLYQILD